MCRTFLTEHLNLKERKRSTAGENAEFAKQDISGR